MNQKSAKRLCVAFFFLGLANFAAFFITALALGGDAVNGKVENGRYYVANHGRYKEVSRATYEYSRLHVHSLWITHPLAILAAIAASRLKRKPETLRQIAAKSGLLRCPPDKHVWEFFDNFPGHEMFECRACKLKKLVDLKTGQETLE